MCAGALVSLSYYLPAFIAYTYASALPLAGSFLLDGRTVYVAMGCMALVFVAAITFAAHHGLVARIGHLAARSGRYRRMGPFLTHAAQYGADGQ